MTLIQTRSLLIVVVILASLYPLSSQADDGISKGTVAGRSKASPSNGIQFDARERAWLQTHKKVKVGTSQYIPLTFIDESGSMAGISADYLSLISERTGLSFEAEYFAWPELMERSKSRRIDLFSGLKNPDRDKYLNFTSPYLNVSYVVINRVDAPFLSDFSNLNGRKVAVVNNWTVHKLLKDEFPNVDIVPYGSLQKALRAVSTRRAEAYVGDLLTASHQIQEQVLNNLKIAAPAPFKDDFVRFAVRKDWPELVSIIEKVLQSITRDQREVILNKWLLVKFDKSVDWSLIWRWVGSIGGFLFLIIIWIGFWNRRLKAKVKEHTGELQKAHSELEIRVEERTRELVGEVSERKLAEETLKNSEQKIKAIIKSVGEGIVSIDSSSKIILVNEELQKIFGYTEEELLGTHISVLIPEKYREAHSDGMINILEGKPSRILGRRIEVMGQKKDGTLFPIELRVEETKAVHDERNFTSAIRDITERKKAEEALKESEARFRSHLENINMIAVGLDNDCKVFYANPSLLKLFGTSRENILGKSWIDNFIPERNRQEMRNVWNSALSEKLYPSYENLILLPDGEERLIKWNNTEVRLHGGKTYGIFFSIGEDITEQKAMRQQLMQSEKLSSIGTFISGIAHELNNPLMSVLGYSQKLMDSENMPNEAMDDLEVISKQSKRTAKIVHELLKFSRTHKAGKANLDVNNAVGSILDFYSHTFKADNIELKRNLSHDLPKVFADSNQLQQVFTNIIVNAYHEIKKVDGQKALTVETMASDERVSITFENSGSPIPEEVIGKIFDPFFTSKKVGEGTGLGLYVSYGIIKDHGGDIKVENIGDAGVRFTISLPVTVEKVTKVVETHTKLRVPKGIRLLFVEDEEPIRKYISSALVKEGISIHLAKDGKEAIELIEKTEYDIILSDIKMPTMNGYELCEWLHENKPYYLERFVLATGIIDVEVEEYSSKYHCLSIIKPYSKDDILETIAELADKYNLGNKEA